MTNILDKKKPSSIKATPELANFISNLDKGNHLDKIITKAREKLSEDMFSGESVPKKQIPKYYFQKYELNNLYVINLDSSRRLSYTLVFNGTGVCCVLLEVFLTHKEYEKRFGYS